MKSNDYSVDDAAKEFNCSKSLIRKLIRAGAIKVYRIGSLVRIPNEEIARIKKANS